MPAEKLTTKQAQDRAGVSRHALMRAKKKGLLFAEADNQGNLLWDGEALDRWAKSGPAATPEPTKPMEAPAPGLWEALAEAAKGRAGPKASGMDCARP